VILDSYEPFTAPHIVITPPPPENPWDSWLNATPRHQDCAFGNRLIVKGVCVKLLNDPDEPDTFESEAEPEELSEDEDEASETLCGNTAETQVPLPGISLDAWDDYDVDYNDEDLWEDSDSDKDADGDGDSESTVSMWEATTAEVYVEDQDSLPELDEWYFKCASYRAEP
jgi:hypothetical protein